MSEQAEQAPRVAITGWSGCGKTYLSQQYPAVFHADDLIDLGWSEASARLAELFDDPAYRTWEGVSIPRAARKWLRQHKTGRPFDQLIVLTRRQRKPTLAQTAQGRGHDRVLREILPELHRRGVVVVMAAKR